MPTLEPIEMDTFKAADYEDDEKLQSQHHKKKRDKLLQSFENQMRFLVTYLQRLASISIVLSSCIFGIGVGDIINSVSEISLIRSVDKHFASETVMDLFDFNLQFLDQWQLIFAVSAICSIVLGLAAIFCFDLKRINRVIFYVVLNFLFVVGDIALVTAALLNVKSFQDHNQSILGSLKTVENKSLAFAATDIFNLSQTRIIVICCLVVSTSILKFVTIPVVLFMFPTTSPRKDSGSLTEIIHYLQSDTAHYSSIVHTHKKSQHSSVSVLHHNKIKIKKKDGKIKAPARLSAFHPPPRCSLKSKESRAKCEKKSADVSDRTSQATESLTSSFLEGHDGTKRRNTLSECSMKRYPSLPSSRRMSDSEMLYGNNQKAGREGVFVSTTPFEQPITPQKIKKKTHNKRLHCYDQDDDEKKEYSPLKR